MIDSDRQLSVPAGLVIFGKVAEVHSATELGGVAAGDGISMLLPEDFFALDCRCSP